MSAGMKHGDSGSWKLSYGIWAEWRNNVGCTVATEMIRGKEVRWEALEYASVIEPWKENEQRNISQSSALREAGSREEAGLHDWGDGCK